MGGLYLYLIVLIHMAIRILNKTIRNRLFKCQSHTSNWVALFFINIVDLLYGVFWILRIAFDSKKSAMYISSEFLLLANVGSYENEVNFSFMRVRPIG